MKDNNEDTQWIIREEYSNPRGCFLLVLAFLLACTSLIISIL